MKNKKNNELYALEKAIEIGKSKNSITKNLALRLSGDFVYRQVEERPDFVKKSLVNNRNDECIIGIEHFKVDHLSLKKKDGKIASKGIMHSIDVSNVYNKWASKIGESSDIDISAAKDIQNLIWSQYNRVTTTNYHTFVSAFDYSLSKHIAKVESYRKELTKLANGKKIELAFLIEVHSEFINKYFTNKKGTQKSKSGIMPIFNDVVEILEQIDSKKVDYIILLLCETQINKNTDVIAFKTGKIFEQLTRQKKIIYEYAGIDFFEPAFSKNLENFKLDKSIYYKDGDIVLDFQYDKANKSDDEHLNNIFKCCERIYNFEKLGKNYITDVSVQLVIDIYRELIFENKMISGVSIKS